jgi:hypothetical protein
METHVTAENSSAESANSQAVRDDLAKAISEKEQVQQALDRSLVTINGLEAQLQSVKQKIELMQFKINMIVWALRD